MVLSSIVVSLLKAVEQYNGAPTEYLAEPILACARVFDETILRLHTSMVLFFNTPLYAETSLAWTKKLTFVFRL